MIIMIRTMMEITIVIMMPMMIRTVTMMKKMTMQLVTAINQNTIMLCSILLKVNIFENRSYVHAGGKCANESDSLGSQDHRGLTLIPTNFLQVLV